MIRHPIKLAIDQLSYAATLEEDIAMGDAHAHILSVTVTEDGEPKNLNDLNIDRAVILLKNREWGPIISDMSLANLENGLIEYTLGETEVSHKGKVIASIYLFAGISRFTVQSLMFDIRGTMEDTEIIEGSGELPLLTSLIAEVDKINDFDYIGNYIESTQYFKHNMVTHNGNTYLVLEDTIGVEPNDDGLIYHLISTKGDKGDQGIPGTDANVTKENVEAVLTGNITTHEHGYSELGHKHTESQITNLDKYTKAEVDNKIAQVLNNMDWKKSVPTFNDIATTYPTPEDGWTVSVDDTDITYRYNGSSWEQISANSIPKATPELDGKMSKEDKAKLDDIETGANKYIHPTNNTNHLTDLEVQKLTNIEDGANLYVHPDNHSLDIITETATKKILTNIERDKLSNIENNANNYIHPTDNVNHLTDAEKTQITSNKNRITQIEVGDIQVENAIRDSNDNIIKDTYETKAEAASKFNTLNTAILNTAAELENTKENIQNFTVANPSGITSVTYADLRANLEVQVFWNGVVLQKDLHYSIDPTTRLIELLGGEIFKKNHEITVITRKAYGISNSTL